MIWIQKDSVQGTKDSTGRDKFCQPSHGRRHFWPEWDVAIFESGKNEKLNYDGLERYLLSRQPRRQLVRGTFRQKEQKVCNDAHGSWHSEAN